MLPITTTINGHAVTITADNIHIEDSHTIADPKLMLYLILDALELVGEDVKQCAWGKRTLTCLVREWQAHNLLYDLHLWRDRTSSVDLDRKQWYDFAYHTLGFIYQLFL